MLMFRFVLKDWAVFPVCCPKSNLFFYQPLHVNCHCPLISVDLKHLDSSSALGVDLKVPIRKILQNLL